MSRTGAVLDDRDVTAELDCDSCGAPPVGRRKGDLNRRHRVTRPDPERASVQVVLCDNCGQLDPRRVDELIMLRRAWFATAWKAGLRPTA